MANVRPVLSLIDGSSYIFRAYHAIPHLSTSKGVPTNAVYGFTLMLLKALKEEQPTHLAIAFDKEARAYRQAIDPLYKANRPETPPDLVPQFPLIRKVVAALRIPVLEVAGFEADDVIATIARRGVAEGFNVIITTGDKDFMQLVGEQVELFDSMAERRTTAAGVLERLLVRPDQVVDLMALTGDEIDNIPGVPGVGPKTAAQLVQRFGSVEELLAHAEGIATSGLRGAKKLEGLIRGHAERIARNKILVTLRADLELGVSPQELARKEMDEPAVRRLFQDLEFSRLLRDLPQPPPGRLPAEVRVVLTKEELEALAARLSGSTSFAVRTLTEGPRPRVDPIVGVAFALPGGETYYLPLGHHYLGVPRQLNRQVAAEALRAVLADPRVAKVGHGLKGEILALRQLSIALSGLSCDTELASHLLNSGRREHALEDLSRERLSCELPADPRQVGRGKRSASAVSIDEARVAVAGAAFAAGRLAEVLCPELQAAGLAPLFKDIELPLLPILARMEEAGVGVNREVLARVGHEVGLLLAEKEQEVTRHAGHAFNINSNPQLASVLFEELKLPVTRRGKSGPSADQEVLEKLSSLHPLPRAVLEYRSLFKLKGSYLDSLPGLVEADGRIHTSFNQALTATGRLSSSDPNLQNIPVRGDLGRRIREAFVAGDGCRLVSADYSQVELRILAHVSGDASLLESFGRGEDVHARTASEVFGVPVAEVTQAMRRAAKAINFGIAYGLTSFGLSQRLDLPPGEAQAIIDRYFERYSGVRRWLDDTVALARREGSVSTLFGRRRFIADINSRNPAVRNAAERIAVNTPIQGTAADLIKRAMIELDLRLRAESLRTRLLLQVHDELLLEVPAEEVARATALTVKAMSGVAQLRVPLSVEVGTGKSWAEAH